MKKRNIYLFLLLTGYAIIQGCLYLIDIKKESHLFHVLSLINTILPWLIFISVIILYFYDDIKSIITGKSEKNQK